MALFLSIMLTISSFLAIGSHPYQTYAGIIGGPTVSAAEPDYTGESLYMYESIPSTGSYGVSETISGAQEGVMETALFEGSEPSAKNTRTGKQTSAFSTSQEGPDLKGYFAMSAYGFNWGKLHPHNAVDIANSCGTDINASADGMINETSMNSWSGGYGNFILISHPNGAKTRYAHLQKILVSVGEYVKQGQLIGKMGETGNATGCHVHFEIIGAANPFAK